MAPRFNADIWINDTQSTIVAFGGKAPKPPDYGPVAAANMHMAQQQYELGQEQLDWAKQQYADWLPYTQYYLDQQLTNMDREAYRAQVADDEYWRTYNPIERSFAETALNYNTPGRAEQNAGAAMADVTNQFDAARRASAMQLESYGIDPSQTRYGALDLSTRIAQAAATAAAGTQSRRNTEATALALQGEAINVGRGYPGAIAQAYTTSTNAGKSGVGSSTDLYKTGASAMGTPTSYMSNANTSMGNAAQAMNYGYDAAYKSAKVQADQSQKFGQMIGGALGFAMPYL